MPPATKANANNENIPRHTSVTVSVCTTPCCCNTKYTTAKTKGPKPQATTPRSRNVAIKILREEFKENEEFIRRFKVESQAAASLSHQNIVQIYDVGEEDGLHYIVMELLEGETLKKYMLSKGNMLSRREAMNYSMQICRALEHAHSKHVVHRDIKPQNIVLTESGKIKVADFGIARAANNSTTLTAGSLAVGSAHYLSPEQARGGYTDNRSDIYSFGVVMYEMFTGKLPFDAEENT